MFTRAFAGRDPRATDRAVQRAEPAARRSHRFRDLGLIGHISGMKERALSERRGEFLDPVRVDTPTGVALR